VRSEYAGESRTERRNEVSEEGRDVKRAINGREAALASGEDEDDEGERRLRRGDLRE